jgi:Fe-S-cluster containining protein
MGMGKYVKIKGSMGPNKYICVHELTNETVYATVEKPYRDTFDPDERDTPEEWCPFLAEGEEEETYVCVIHGTRPRFCRDFVCASMRIYTQDGVEAGKVSGKGSLVSSDDHLNALWKEQINPISAGIDEEWKTKAIEVLESEGYRIEVYE